MGLIPHRVHNRAVAAGKGTGGRGPWPAPSWFQCVDDRLEVGKLGSGTDRKVLVGRRVGQVRRELEQPLERGGLVWQSFEGLRERRRRALLVNDQPQMSARSGGEVGEASECRVGEGVRTQDDQVVDPLGAQMHVHEAPHRISAGPDLGVLAERREQAPRQPGASAAGCGLAHDLAEGAGVQAAQARQDVDVVVAVEDDGEGAVSGPRHRAMRRRCGSAARQAVRVRAVPSGAARWR